MGRKEAKAEPMTIRQRHLVQKYLAKWNPLRFVKGCWPGVYRQAIRAGMSDEDIGQQATLGVMRAARNYDPNRGGSFSTHANWWAMSRVSHAIREVDRQRRIGRVVRGDKQWEAGEGEGMTAWEGLGVSDGTRPQDDPEENDRLATLRMNVAMIMRQLPEPLRRIIELRFGLIDRRPRILEEVAEELGITRERVRQLELKALARISIPLQLACWGLLKLGRKAGSRRK